MQSLLRDLLNRLDAIAEDHEEFGDTDVREAMLDAVFDGLIQPIPGFELSGNYKMGSDEGNQAIRTVLAWFLPAANSSVRDLGLDTFKDRLAAFQDADVMSERGSYFDDYFGWVNPARFDESGRCLDPHDR